MRAQKNQNRKASTFRALHGRDGAFVIVNPLDTGSVKFREEIGALKRRPPPISN